MNKEELIALGVTEEAAKAIVEKQEAEVQGLVSKRDELLKKLNESKGESSELKAFKEEIAPLLERLKQA